MTKPISSPKWNASQMIADRATHWSFSVRKIWLELALIGFIVLLYALNQKSAPMPPPAAPKEFSPLIELPLFKTVTDPGSLAASTTLTVIVIGDSDQPSERFTEVMLVDAIDARGKPVSSLSGDGVALRVVLPRGEGDENLSAFVRAVTHATKIYVLSK